VEVFTIEVILAATMSFIFAVIFSFTFNKIWTFQNRSKNIRKQFIKFLIVSVIGLLLTVSLMFVFVKLLHIFYLLSKIMTSVIVLLWNFLANKLWTFAYSYLEFNRMDEFEYGLSVVVPAYNEEHRFKPSLLEMSNYLVSSDHNYEIVVVNDGSTDKTLDTLEELKSQVPSLTIVSYDQNRGKGYAVKMGVMAATGKYILFTDADNSTPLDQLPRLINALESSHADIAIGSRYMDQSNVIISQPKSRVLLGRFANFLIRLFLIDGIKDTQCGFKLFKNNVAKLIFNLQRVQRFAFDMEALCIAKNYDYKVVEVPVNWLDTPGSKVRPVKDAFLTLKDLVYIKLNLWSGRYEKE